MADSDISTDESSSTITSSDESEAELRLFSFQTPKKRKYKRTLHHGISKKMASYFGVSPGKATDLRPSSIEQSTSEHVHNITENDDRQGTFMREQFSESSSVRSTDSDCTSTSQGSDDSDVSTCSSDLSSDRDLSSSSETSSTCPEQNYSKEGRNETLDDFIFEGCRHTQRSAYTMIMLFVMQNSLTNEAFSRLLVLISSFLPESATDRFTQSIYKLKETLKSAIGFQEPKVHQYCEECQQYCREEFCGNDVCRGGNNGRLLEFVDLQVEQQLKDLFKGLSISNYLYF